MDAQPDDRTHDVDLRHDSDAPPDTLQDAPQHAPPDASTHEDSSVADPAAPSSSRKLDPKDDATCPPPDEPTMVYCLHCGQEYLSSEMKFRAPKPADATKSGFWWCPTAGCDAGGFGIDIFPTDPEWKDPKGLLEFITEGDEEEFEFEDEDDEEF